MKAIDEQYFPALYLLCCMFLPSQLVDEIPKCDSNPLNPDLRMHILITDLHTFLMEQVRRICLNIKTSYPW